MSLDTIPIPPWDTSRLLPPFYNDPTGDPRAPYPVSLVETVERFATSPERIRILQGFLNYRAKWHELGCHEGFQWLNGSFMEDIETLESGPPNDIDVVTFWLIPKAPHLESLREWVERHSPNDALRKEFEVDCYYVNLNTDADWLIDAAAYWYSVWSHRRNRVWKGFLRIDLDSAEDAAAHRALSNVESSQ